MCVVRVTNAVSVLPATWQAAVQSLPEATHQRKGIYADRKVAIVICGDHAASFACLLRDTLSNRTAVVLEAAGPSALVTTKQRLLIFLLCHVVLNSSLLGAAPLLERLWVVQAPALENTSDDGEDGLAGAHTQVGRQHALELR